MFPVDPRRARRAPPLGRYLAVVHTLDGVCFAAAAASRRELVERVAGYVRRHAAEQLWPAGARQVETLLDGGELDTAVELYFALVGERWDEEWLITAAVGEPASEGLLALLDGVVLPASGDGGPAAAD